MWQRRRRRRRRLGMTKGGRGGGLGRKKQRTSAGPLVGEDRGEEAIAYGFFRAYSAHRAYRVQAGTAQPVSLVSMIRTQRS